jgi:hypothetical protein
MFIARLRISFKTIQAIKQALKQELKQAIQQEIERSQIGLVCTQPSGKRGRERIAFSAPLKRLSGFGMGRGLS